MPDVFSVADRVVVLRRGRKVADKPIAGSSPEEVTWADYRGNRARVVMKVRSGSGRRKFE